MSSLRVLMTAQQLRRTASGGIGIYVENLVRAVQGLDVETGVWASKKWRGSDPLARLGVHVHTSPVPGPALTRLWDRGLMGAPAQWSVVHATSLAVPPSKGSVLTAMVHDLAWREIPEAYPERGRRWHEAALGRAIDRARLLFVPSVQTQKALIDEGVDPARIVHAPPGCDHLPEPDVEGTTLLLESAGVVGPFLLAVGTLEPRKNLPALMDAYSRVRSELPEPWPLVIAGRTGWGKDIDPMSGVHIVQGPTSGQIAELYNRCELLAYVPYVEGYGLPVVEAMSMGAPVVASSVPAAGSAAYLVDPNNTAAIAEGILRVASDVALRHELTRKGRAHVARLTWRSCAVTHMGAWEGIV